MLTRALALDKVLTLCYNNIKTNKGENMKKQQLLDKINELELKLFIYSDRDDVRTKQLEKELRKLDMILLDMMDKERVA